MSFDGRQRIAIVRAPDESAVEERVLEIFEELDDSIAHGSKGIGLGYTFGFGETHPVEIEHLEAVIALPWIKVETDANEAELRALPNKVMQKAVDALEMIRKRPKTVLRRIATCLEEDEPDEAAAAILESDPKEPEPAEAVTTASRIAQILMQLRRHARVALNKEQALGIAILIEPH
jgi:hypothetical protein